MRRRAVVLVLLLAWFPSTPAVLYAQALKVSTPLADLEARARQDSNDAEAQYSVALGYWSKKRYDDAERALRLAVTIEPRFAAGWLALATLPYARRPKLRNELAKGKVPEEWKPTLVESQRLMRRAFLIDPLVDLKILAAVDPPQPLKVAVGGGFVVVFANPFAAFQEGRYDEAFFRFDGMMQRRGTPVPRDSVPSYVLWYHGLSAAHLRRYDAAIADLQTLVERAEAREHGDSLITVPLMTNDYRYVLALLQARANQPLDAIRLFREALTYDLGLYMAHVQLYKIFEVQRMWDSAVVESRAAVMTNPEDPSLLLDHGIFLTQAGALTAAEDTLRRAMDMNPRDSRVPYFLCITEGKMNNTAGARAAIERFLALAPSRYEQQIRDAREWLASLP